MDTLDLDGDSIDDLVDEVEEAFALRFAGDELLTVLTVGDLHDRVMARLRSDPGLCATSMAFYRIRRALAAEGQRGVVRPDTLLPTDTEARPRRLLPRLGTGSGLRGLYATAGWMGAVGGWLILGVIALIVIAWAERAWLFAWAALALAFASAGLLILDRGRWPNGMRTVGELAQYAVAKNHGGLVAQGAVARDNEVWSSLQIIASEFARLDPSEVQRNTTFFRKKANRAA